MLRILAYNLAGPAKGDAAEVKAWCIAEKVSISKAAQQFGLSDSTVKRYCVS